MNGNDPDETPTLLATFGYVQLTSRRPVDASCDEGLGGRVVSAPQSLFIQRAEHRDTQALHAKLDELLHAAGHARNELTKIDNEEPEDIENRRKIDRVYD
jgi:hypothetical protein